MVGSIMTLIGVITGAVICTICKGDAKLVLKPKKEVKETVYDDAEQRLAKQWQNILNYTGMKNGGGTDEK